jgi:hypothetical protein
MYNNYRVKSSFEHNATPRPVEPPHNRFGSAVRRDRPVSVKKKGRSA